MVSLLGSDPQHLRALLGVVGAAEQLVHLLERDLLGLGDEEVDKDAEDDVHGHEEEEAVEPLVGEEGGEELLEDCVCDVLHLGAHADGLGADVDGEDFGGPHPGCCAPCWLVEEDDLGDVS